MVELDSRPLLTFAVVAFNQGRFVEEAVDAALAQSYSPLEIILSDDCSSDNTFEIMRQKAAGYRGPHRLILNRNPVRRSIGGHINRVMELAHGALVVGSAGDDVSLPERTTVVHEAWEKSGRTATSIHSNYIQIDEHGQPIAPIFKPGCRVRAQHIEEQKGSPLAFVERLEPSVTGCAHAFSPRLFALFGPLPEHIIHEDEALAFRSVLAGRIFYIAEPLVRYRLHAENVFLRSNARRIDLKAVTQQEDCLSRDLRNRETMYAGFLLDLLRARAQRIIGDAAFEQVAREIVQRQRRYSEEQEFLASGFFKRCRLLGRLRTEGLSREESKMLARRLVPRGLLLRQRLARNYVHSLGIHLFKAWLHEIQWSKRLYQSQVHNRTERADRRQLGGL